MGFVSERAWDGRFKTALRLFRRNEAHLASSAFELRPEHAFEFAGEHLRKKLCRREIDPVELLTAVGTQDDWPVGGFAFRQPKEGVSVGIRPPREKARRFRVDAIRDRSFVADRLDLSESIADAKCPLLVDGVEWIDEIERDPPLIAELAAALRLRDVEVVRRGLKGGLKGVRPEWH